MRGYELSGPLGWVCRYVMVMIAALGVGYLAWAPSVPAANAEPRMSVTAHPGDATSMVVAGRLVDRINRPVAGATVSVRIDGATIGAAQTDSSGAFAVDRRRADRQQRGLRGPGRDPRGRHSPGRGGLRRPAVLERLQRLDRVRGPGLARPDNRRRPDDRSQAPGGE